MLRPLPLRLLELDPRAEDDDDVPLSSLASQRLRVGLASAGAGASADELALDEADEAADEDLDPDRAVRIRRGSEGFEVRPRVGAPVFGGARRSAGSGRGGDESWEHVPRGLGKAGGGEQCEEGQEQDGGAESEWEIDDEGDRRRVGPRYRYYVREEDSESDTDASLSS